MDKSKCLRCGEGEPSYCEKCYQDLIGENARLQYHLTKVIPTEERLVRLQDIINHFEKIKDTHQTVEINSEDIKAIEELIATNQHLKHKYESYYKLYWEESVPVSLIQNKKDEIEKMIEQSIKGNLQKYTIPEMIYFKGFLNELLEEREEDNE